MTLLLPTDGCPECVTGDPVHPYQVHPQGRAGGIKAWYWCPVCGRRWPCWWAPEAAELPCPGCDLCVAEARGGAA